MTVSFASLFFPYSLDSDLRLFSRHLSKAFLARSGNCLIRRRAGVSLTPVVGEMKEDFIASIQSSLSKMVPATSLGKEPFLMPFYTPFQIEF